MEIQTRLYRADQVRELDRRAIQNHSIPGYELMSRAGDRAWRVLRALWPSARAVTVACGGGNNGGDGYIVATRALESGLEVQAIALVDPASLSGDARSAADAFLAAGGALADSSQALTGSVVVDALLGTGLDRSVREPHAGLIRRINDSGLPVLALDVPSGLNADTGMPMGCAVRADATVSFIGQKRGLWTGRGPGLAGQRIFEVLDVPDSVYGGLKPDARLAGAGDIEALVPRREADTHKGQCGRVLVGGGDRGMPGSVILAARAALRAGAGLVTVATSPHHADALGPGVPEAMWSRFESPGDLDALLASVDVLAIGPGLGQADWGQALFSHLIGQPRSVVLDADGLNLLAANPIRRDDWVITPHPGEAARLLGIEVERVQEDRFRTARDLAERFGAVCVLKGSGTLVADPDGRVDVCPVGSAAMASAGMGDALTGIVAALMGQGLSPRDAALAGVLIHGLAGERAARRRRQILASDLVESVPGVMHPPAANPAVQRP